MNKKVIAAGVVVALLAAGGYWAKSAVTQKAAQMQKSALATAPVKRGPLDVSVSGTASIVAYEKVTVRASVGGTVSKVYAQDGQAVTEGQPVMLISNETLVRALEQARLDYESQQRRLSTLKSPSDADRAQAESRLQLAAQTLDNRRKSIDKLSIKSPTVGRVASVRVNAGDVVAPTQLLVSIVDDTSVYVVAQVPQSEIAKVKVGQTASISFGTDLPSASGVVDSIGVEGTYSTTARTTVIPVSIKVANPSGTYRVGLAANATITSADDESVSASGTVVAKSRYDVRAEVAGTVHAVSVRDNDSVTPGQLLIEIENDDMAVALEQAEADLEVATEYLNKIQSGLMPNVSADDAAQQQIRVQQAELAVETRGADVEYLEPKAPISGTVNNLVVTRGETITPGTPLFTISDYAKMKMVISVDELDIARVKVGQEASVKVEAVGRQYKGVVTKVATEGTARDGVSSYLVEVTLDDPKDLRGGMSGTAKISLARLDNVLMVPSEAIWMEDDKITVQVIKDGVPVRVEVQIGLMSPTYTEIVSGLNEGDMVVLSSTSDMGVFSIMGGK